ncbi:sensor histidine kinase [Desulfomicrobium baculatum]|nr:HAMP domain-containing sensor histidine kinase [Desulfomicrobium baculatum]
MQPSLHARKHIKARLLERLAGCAADDSAAARSTALNLFFEASFEFESLRDLKSLCVLVPDVCLKTPASLYMRGPKDTLRLRRTTSTLGPRLVTFPEPSCPDPVAIARRDGLTAVPICETGPEPKLLGMLCLHKDLSPDEETFYLGFVRSAAQLMAVKQIAISNRHRLTFINNLVRDIGHNVIVPNMHFKLLFLQMEKQLERLGRIVDALPPMRSDAPDREARRELAAMAKELQIRQKSISRRFQQSSLFLESLLRRGHFEKGSYDLQLRPCKFKSQIFEPQLERFRPLLSAQGISIRIAPDVRIDEDLVLEADLGLIAQVFANLLSNAVKYTVSMPTESGRDEKLVIYGWESQPHAFGPGQPGIELYIRTTGHEIPSQDWPQLFDADFRSSATDDVEGSGHGLFFVKQIVELHNGRVGYSYATPMNTFSIILPCRNNSQASTEPGSCHIPS